jgi:hypothetical protein
MRRVASTTVIFRRLRGDRVGIGFIACQEASAKEAPPTAASANSVSIDCQEQTPVVELKVPYPTTRARNVRLRRRLGRRHAKEMSGATGRTALSNIRRGGKLSGRRRTGGRFVLEYRKNGPPNPSFPGKESVLWRTMELGLGRPPAATVVSPARTLETLRPSTGGRAKRDEAPWHSGHARSLPAFQTAPLQSSHYGAFFGAPSCPHWAEHAPVSSHQHTQLELRLWSWNAGTAFTLNS